MICSSHDISEILLMLALNTNQSINHIKLRLYDLKIYPSNSFQTLPVHPFPTQISQVTLFQYIYGYIIRV